MAKKKTAAKTSKSAAKTAADAEQSPEVQQAADAVCKAQTELEKAQQLYQELRSQATERLQHVREKTVGDLIDDTLETVRKHPGPGVVVAGLIGFFLGRWLGGLFRR